MKKTYWWRILVLILDVLFIGIAYIIGNQLLFGICDNIYYFGENQRCLDEYSHTIAKPLFIFFLSLFAISPFLFFIRDEVFLKWLRFAGVWFFTATILIILLPEYSSGVVGNPTKEIVSIWMGLLFVIISFSIIIYKSFKLRGK